LERQYCRIKVQGRGSVDDDLLEAIIIEKTGWTHDQYMNQPAWLIDTILMINNEKSRGN